VGDGGCGRRMHGEPEDMATLTKAHKQVQVGAMVDPGGHAALATSP